LIRDGEWLDRQVLPPLTYIVPKLLPAGLTLIAGPPKIGKSLMVLDWLLAVAAGGLALGKLPIGQAQDVLCLALEDGDRRLQARCRDLLADGEPIPAQLRYILSVPPGQVLAVLGRALAEHPATALVVIDTLARVMPPPVPGESAYLRDYQVASSIKRIADKRPGLGVGLVHHSRKARGDDFIDDVSGTHGIAGAADTIILVRRSRGQGEGRLQVTGRDVMEAEYALNFHEGAWSLDGDTLGDARANVARRADAAVLDDRSAQIIEFVRQRPGPTPAADITGKFGNDAASYLRRLVDSQRLIRLKRGLYAVPVSEASEVSETQVNGGEETDVTLWGVSEVSETETRPAP
jgi:hypothetical protein